MKKEYINQLNKIWSELDQLRNQMMTDAEAVKENAGDQDRDMTEAESEKYYELMYYAYDLDCAFDYIPPYHR